LAHSNSSGGQTTGYAADDDDGARGGAPAPTKSLIEFLDGLPVSSVGQKHTAVFECDLDAETTSKPNFKVSRLLSEHTTTPGPRNVGGCQHPTRCVPEKLI
jgi:hypothetical protein